MLKPVRFLCLFFIVIPLTFACSSKNIAERPNIVIMLADDQGWGDLSMNGNPDLSTPNIDQMASEGVVMEQFYVCPLCAPTRAELLTGRYYPRTGVSGVSEGRERLNLDETTLANIFREAGYKTAAFGKWHSGTQYPYHPLGRGFDEFYGFCSGHWGNYFSPLLDHNGAMINGQGYLTDDLTSQAIEFMKAHTEDEAHTGEPFLVYLPFNTPHSPMQVPENWWERFKDYELTTDHAMREKEVLDHTRAAYAMCENIDWNIGRVIAALQELGIEKNTIVIYFSDNGPNGWRWNGGMKGKKAHTDEGGVRSPFIIRWPGTLKEGYTVEEIAGAIDLLPTLADMAGISFETEQPLDGKSLEPLIRGKRVDWEPRYIASIWRESVSIRDQRFRLDRDKRLFDMVADPGQTKDVSAEFPEDYARMLEYREAWLADVLKDVPAEDTRTFPVGHADFPISQLPARDAKPHGTVKRSSIHPNDSYMTHWTSTSDSITWEVEVMESGKYTAELFYTCSEENVGSTIRLSAGGSSSETRVEVAHDPPLEGADRDKVPRIESYTKDFIPMTVGEITLEKGLETIVLTAPEIPGEEVMDVRLLMLQRVSPD